MSLPGDTAAPSDIAVRPVLSGQCAVLLDVDFTVLCPGEQFSAEGYRAAGARFGLRLDPGRWREAERCAARAVEARRAGRGNVHDDEVYDVIAEAIVTAMGGDDTDRVGVLRRRHRRRLGPLRELLALRDVRPCLTRLRAAGLVVGLVSNTNRDLGEVLDVFALRELVDGAVTSAQVGLFKPAPEIFAAALACVGAAAGETVMVGDSYRDDVEGALAAGLVGRAARPRWAGPGAAPGARAALVHRLARRAARPARPAARDRAAKAPACPDSAPGVSSWASARRACGSRSGTGSCCRR